ncbi:MAG: DUF1934 domain-containing protein [Bacillaceae bacterium]|nr:DUF1934 domain-containing protein [Bacillaceae bacterium]
MAGTRSMNVHIKLKNVIEDQGKKEEMVITQMGRCFFKGDTTIVLFDEEDEQGNVIQTMVTIQPGRAMIKRNGKIRMNQMFKPGQKTETVYHHPYGTMLMETYTDQLVFTESEEQGTLNIEYQLSLNGQEPRNHYLRFTYVKEV